MSHAVNIRTLLEQLLVLEHLALGSFEVFKSNGVTSFDETGYLEPLSFHSLLKGVVCENLINCAVKGRILLDHVTTDTQVNLDNIQKQAVLALQISYDAQDEENLTLRESLNKIIHATQVEISITEDEFIPDNSHYWDGQVHVVGAYRKKKWSHCLLVGNWAKAMRRLILQLLKEDRLYMLGWNTMPGS